MEKNVLIYNVLMWEKHLEKKEEKTTTHFGSGLYRQTDLGKDHL